MGNNSASFWRALIARPVLLVLHEPTSGVDMRSVENILHLLAELNRRGSR